MQIDAKNFQGDKQRKPALCQAFRVSNAADTIRLARVFSQACFPAGYKNFRIGLASNHTYAGKSTFAQAVLSCFPNRISREKANSEAEQNIWEIPQTGWIRHYDAGYGEWQEKCLPSYWHNDTSRYGSPLADIVENPAFDRHNTHFDCLIEFNSPADPRDNSRIITIMATEKFAQTQDFQTFLHKAASWLTQTTPGISLTLNRP